ncbi:MAG: hypothetical protein GVX96_03075 [Bacteroidetes bacterium]|jgi:hypothetical protein|nr:hypothetical protein [Bacteroidota bacterium]
MAENKDTNNDQRDSEEQSGRMQANTIWGTGFVRISLYILLGFILLATSRYVYLKVTDQYPANFEEQSIIQYPHLEQMNSNTDSKKNEADQSETEESNSSKNEQNEGAGQDSISQNGRRR